MISKPSFKIAKPSFTEREFLTILNRMNRAGVKTPDYRFQNCLEAILGPPPKDLHLYCPDEPIVLDVKMAQKLAEHPEKVLYRPVPIDPIELLDIAQYGESINEYLQVRAHIYEREYAASGYLFKNRQALIKNMFHAWSDSDFYPTYCMLYLYSLYELKHWLNMRKLSYDNLLWAELNLDDEDNDDVKALLFSNTNWYI